MADGFVELRPDDLKNNSGIEELNRMLRLLFDNVAGDADTRRVFSGVGSPEDVVVAGVGSIYMRTDGGAGSSVYIKESGSGATGWQAK
jgi:hypothetical protein